MGEPQTKAKYREQAVRRKTALKAAGICTNCGSTPAAPGVVVCEACRERAASRRKCRAEKLFSAGMCIRCGVEPSIGGSKVCQKCRDYTSRRNELRREKNRSDGVCEGCGGPPRRGKSLCAECAKRSIETQRERRLGRVRNGVCLYCGTRAAEENTQRCAECAESQRWSKIRGKYGLGRDEYEARLALQGGACGCCGDTSTGNRRSEWLFVDHDHATGMVRGLLCHSCNVMAGQVGDDVQRLRRLIQYLQGEATWQKKRLPAPNRVLLLLPGKEGAG